MNHEPQNPRQELEARLTALVLGELSVEEAAALQETIRRDPELAALQERLKRTIGLVKETAASPAEQTAAQAPPLRLSNDRREKLLAHFKTIKPKEFARPRWWEVRLTALTAAAAVVIALIGVAMFLPALSKSKSKAQTLAYRSQPESVFGRLSDFGLSSKHAASAPTPSSPPPGSEVHNLNYNTWALDDSGKRSPMTVQQGAKTDLSNANRAGNEHPGIVWSTQVQPPQEADTLQHVASPGVAFYSYSTPPTQPEPASNQPTVPGTTILTGVTPVLGDRRAKIELPSETTPPNTEVASRSAGELPVPIMSSPESMQVANEPTTGLPVQLGVPTTTTNFAVIAGREKTRAFGDVPLADQPPGTFSNNGQLNFDFKPGLGTEQQGEDKEQMGERQQAAVENRSKQSAFSESLAVADKQTIFSIDPESRRLEVLSPKAQAELAANKDKENAALARTYSEAERKLQEQQKFAQLLNEKLLSESTGSALPKSSQVEIIDSAETVPEKAPTLGARLRGALGGKVERSARIKIERDQSDVAGLNQQRAAGFDPYFIQSEFEVVQSDRVLGKVVKDLKLDEAWADKNGGKKLTDDEAVKLLKKNLDLRPVPNTSLVDIGVKSQKPQEAAQLANAVAQAYRDYRMDERKRLSAGGTQALQGGLAEQDKRIAAAQAEVDRLREVMIAATNQPADAPLARPATPAPVPQPEVQTRDNAFSTFSLNVSDVSFKLAAASLEKGVMPEPNTVRAEEFINAFDYRDPEPAPGAPIAFTSERAQDPFAQNRDFLRFSLKTAAQGRQAGRPLNLVLLLDNSGSMERADRVQIIHEALRVLATQLQPQDTLSIVTFARTARLFVDGVPGSQAGKAVEEVSGLTPQGGTNLEEAMNLAYQTALRHYLANGINRVVLLTDGAANLGDVEPESLKQKVETNRKQGIALDCFGIGWEDYNDELLEVLSRNGDGRYGFLNTPDEAATGFASQLAGALQVAASDVKVQVEFNPNRVAAYRQIGYAKHQLTKEQFRDNSVNAAQLGAAEAGNALYAVEVNPAGTGPLATVRVRYRVPSTSDYREQEWTVDYTGSAVALEQASPAMRLAATASAFAEWLASSPCAAEVTPDRLLGFFRGVPDVYGADTRPKNLEWMLHQARSLQGK